MAQLYSPRAYALRALRVRAPQLGMVPIAQATPCARGALCELCGSKVLSLPSRNAVNFLSAAIEASRTPSLAFLRGLSFLGIPL
jgi:hypothetical protein